MAPTRMDNVGIVVDDLEAAIRLAGEVEPPPSRRALREEVAAAE